MAYQHVDEAEREYYTKWKKVLYEKAYEKAYKEAYIKSYNKAKKETTKRIAKNLVHMGMEIA